MKKYLLGLGIILSGPMTFAACFNFINGKGPERMGNAFFAAQAKQVCISVTSQIGGGEYTSIRFSDEEGDLAIFSGEVTAKGRCLSLCQVVELTSGNVNGENVNVGDAKVSIQTEMDHSLGMAKGLIEVRAGRSFPQKFLILEKR